MSDERWRLARTRQCGKCPWRVATDPTTIPNGYSEERHRGLAGTIAKEADLASVYDPLVAMACHETEDAYCVGWLAHQLGPGNNLALRVRMFSCENARDIQLLGEQHETFEDTLPR